MSMILSTEAPVATWVDLLPVLVPMIVLLLLAAALGGGWRR